MSRDKQQQKIENLEIQVQRLTEAAARVQGHLSVLSYLALRLAVDSAMAAPDAYRWAETCMAAFATDFKEPQVNVEDPIVREFVRAGMSDAVNDFLQNMMAVAGSLPGAPTRAQG